MSNPTTAEQEINALITFESYRRQLFRVAFMRKMGKGGLALMVEENRLARLWAKVKPMTALKTRPVYEYLNAHTPYDACRYMALKGRLPKAGSLPKDYQGWAVQAQ